MATRTKKEPVNRIAAVEAAQVPNGKAKDEREQVVIKPPRMKSIVLPITGTSPLMILRFSAKARNMILETQKAGSQAKSKKTRAPKDFEGDYRGALYLCKPKGEPEWAGINAAGFRNAMISMCRLVGYHMTLAKLSVFVVADGYDYLDRTPLVRIYGEHEMNISPVRNASGVIDLRARALWPEWKSNVAITFDEDQFSSSDITNLLSRVGLQGGVGEGRPNGRDGFGCGNGLFTIDLG